MAKKPTTKTDDIDNDPMFDTSTDARNNAINRNLVQFLERIERLQEEQKAFTDDIKGVFSEAKSTGFAPKIMRKILALRRMDKDARDEEDALVETYRREVGI